MSRCFWFLAFALLLCPSATSARAEEDAVITTRTDTVGRLLNGWAKEHSAAGLKLIQYENRDGQHSPLNLLLYPGLTAYQPTDEEKTTGRDKAAAYVVRPRPTVGNCSMAANPTAGGSLPRLYYTQVGGLTFLNQQYLTNNLIIYPEHLDHDPGANGVGGWGDLYPTNSPCLIISQGSSFTDQPFLNSVLTTIAAFDPDVLTEIVRKRILMPTVQAVFRQSNKMVKSEEDYFTGKAHPVVFDGTLIDEEKMVLTAHTMTRAAIPPVVIVRVMSESAATAGGDFFELPGITSEKLGETPSVIARVFRSNDAEREMVISTAASADLLKRPVKVQCSLLQGDPSLVKIEPGDNAGEFRLRVKWHMPMMTGVGVRSHRVEIGVFASNGVSSSAPAFVTFYMLPNEVRSYDAKGRVADIFYEAPNPDLGLPTTLSDARWLEVFRAIAKPDAGLAREWIESHFTAKFRRSLAQPASELQARQRALDELKKDETQKDEAAKLQSALDRDVGTLLAGRAIDDEAAAATVREVIERGFEAMAKPPMLFPSHQRAIERLAAASRKTTAAADLAAEVKRLIDFGILIEEAGGRVQPVHAADQLSSGERHFLQCLNRLVLSQAVFSAALERSTAPAYVDPRLTTPKPWRDVFRYDAKGHPAGWVRYFERRTHVFDAEGRLLPGGTVAPEKATPVTYKDDGKGRLTFAPK